MTRLAFAALAAILCGTALNATTYPQLTFGELITKADVIFVGTVRDVRPFSTPTREGSIIKTRVIFDVSESMYGDAGTTQVMDFFGGEMNGVGMAIAEMPKFVAGHRHVVFAYRRGGINPIVGFTQGLMRLKANASGVERVLTYDGVALDRPERIGATSAPPEGDLPAMTLPQLRDRVRGALIEARRR